MRFDPSTRIESDEGQLRESWPSCFSRVIVATRSRLRSVEEDQDLSSQGHVQEVARRDSRQRRVGSTWRRFVLDEADVKTTKGLGGSGRAAPPARAITKEGRDGKQ